MNENEQQKKSYFRFFLARAVVAVAVTACQKSQRTFNNMNKFSIKIDSTFGASYCVSDKHMIMSASHRPLLIDSVKYFVFYRLRATVVSRLQYHRRRGCRRRRRRFFLPFLMFAISFHSTQHGPFISNSWTMTFIFSPHQKSTAPHIFTLTVVTFRRMAFCSR